MSVTTIQFSSEEKSKLAVYLTDRIKGILNKQNALIKEHAILEASSVNIPSGAPESFIDHLRQKKEEWFNNINNIEFEVKGLNTFIKVINEGETFKVATNYKNVLKELRDREKRSKPLEDKFNFYPRLKKAKEESIYEFAYKIEILMEAEHVKVA